MSCKKIIKTSFIYRLFSFHISISNCIFTGTRETAFVNAILAAGVTHSVTRACSRGDYIECGCDRSHRGPPGVGAITPNATWRWGGCSEEVRYALKLTRDFSTPKVTSTTPRTEMDRHNAEAGRKVTK